MTEGTEISNDKFSRLFAWPPAAELIVSRARFATGLAP